MPTPIPASSTAHTMVMETEAIIERYERDLSRMRRELAAMPPHAEGDIMDTVVRCGLRGEIQTTEKFLTVLRRRLATQRHTLRAAEGRARP